MSETLTVAEVVRHFAEYINRVDDRRESFVVVRGDKPIAELRPLPAGRRLEDIPALLAAVPHLSAEEAAEFADDLIAMQ